MSGTDVLLNYSEVALGLLESYLGSLVRALQTAGLGEDASRHVAERFQVSSGLYLSLQPQYKKSAVSFREFCRDRGLTSSLADALTARLGADFRLYRHQEKAIESILAGVPTVISTGTGSGKTESFLIPIIDHCVKNRSRGTKAVLLYPMNALANDQLSRLKDLTAGTSVSYGVLTGATPYDPPEEKDEDSPNHIRSRREMVENPPDILLTNYVMLERLLTSKRLGPLLVSSRQSLGFVVLDELHTYRGSRAAHLMLLLRRLHQRLAKTPLIIGASATLLRSVGYFSATEADTALLDEFLRKVLGVEQYLYVPPEEDELSEDSAVPWPEHAGGASPSVGPAATIDEQTALLSHVAGVRLSEREFRTANALEETDFGRRLAGHPFVAALRRTLRERGAQSLADITRLYRESCPHPISLEQATQEVRSWLVAIGLVNGIWGKKPFLDLRLHVFIRALAGALHGCLTCDTYHPEGGGICPQCGAPLYPVDKRDVRVCLAKVRGRQLIPDLGAVDEDTGREFFVCVSRRDGSGAAEDGHAAGVRCRIADVQEDMPSEDGVSLRIEPAADGPLLLMPANAQHANDLRSQQVLLSDRIHPRQHLRELIATILTYQPRSSRKLLAFVDDRERASQDSTVLRDEFASAYFERLLCKVCPVDPPFLSIPDTLEALHERASELREDERLNRETRSLLDELDLWFFRLLGEPIRFAPSRRGLLQIRSAEQLSATEARVVQVFLDERAINARFKDALADSRYIKFQKRWAVTRRQIHLTPSDSPEGPDVASISLSSDAKEYQGLLTDLGTVACQAQGTTSKGPRDILEKGAEEVLNTVKGLSNKGILDVCCEDGKQRYALNPRNVCVVPEVFRQAGVPHCMNASDELDLLVAAFHSAELGAEDRAAVEQSFREGRTSFLLATPTLEMGIDIGDLQCVFMVGAPPMPSSYAQRAGRAGRRSGRLAMTVCYCSDEKSHDRHFFSRPGDMINGLIAPPSFHQPHWDIVLKHARAVLLAGRLDTTRDLDAFLAAGSDSVRERLALAEELAPTESAEVLRDYALTKLLNECRDHLKRAERHGIPPANLLYEIGYLPDYGFHHDMVRAYDADRYAALQVNGEVSPLNRDHLSEREPELAVLKFAPDRVGYMAGDVFTFQAAGEYTTWSLPEELTRARDPVRSYKLVTARKQVLHATKDALNPRYDRVILYDAKGTETLVRGILRVVHDPCCRFLFLNRGVYVNDETHVFRDDSGPYVLGYELVRDAIILTLPREILSDTEVVLSFLSAIDRRLKDRFRLDESEMRIVTNALPWGGIDGPKTDPKWYHFVFYDPTGNGDLPLRRAFDQVELLLREAAQRLRECPHCQTADTDGCYYCLKSYYTQYIAPFASRAKAMNLLNYLSGVAPLVPSVQRYERTSRDCAATLEIRWRNNELNAGPPGVEPMKANKQDAMTVYATAAAAIRKWYSGGGPSLRVASNLEFLVRNINGETTAGEGRSAFAEMQFELLRFHRISGEKLQ